LHLFPTPAYGNQDGQRAALSMKAALTNTDVLVGWTTINGAPYLVREKSPFEADFDSTKLSKTADFSDSKFEFSVDVASINTEIEARDNHLKSADFFDVANFAKC
jgi:hypothetical protein